MLFEIFNTQKFNQNFGKLTRFFYTWFKLSHKTRRMFFKCYFHIYLGCSQIWLNVHVGHSHFGKITGPKSHRVLWPGIVFADVIWGKQSVKYKEVMPWYGDLYAHESTLTWASCCYALPIYHFIFYNVFECKYLGNGHMVLLLMLWCKCDHICGTL